MRDNEKILNREDEKRNIFRPVICAVAAVCLLIGLLIWFGVKKPELFGKMRDLAVVLVIFFFFIINTAAAVLFFILSSRIGSARDALDKAITFADGKVEELADKVADILRMILEPFIRAESEKAGILSIFSKKKTE